MNYWLSPTGQVWAEQTIGCHYERAVKIIEEKYDYVFDENGLLPTNIDAIDFLEKKNYIRYMNWGTKQWVIRTQKPTKKQIDKMFELTGFFYAT